MDEGHTNYSGRGKLFVFTKKKRQEGKLTMKVMCEMCDVFLQKSVRVLRAVWGLIDTDLILWLA